MSFFLRCFLVSFVSQIYFLGKTIAMNKNILVVEDNKVLLEVIAFKLKFEGYEVDVADSGWNALDIVATKKIDLIICDIMVPNLTGFSLLNLINRIYYGRIPVILISSLKEINIIKSAKRLGASSFMKKPLDFKKLLPQVKKLLFSSKNLFKEGF